MKRYLLLTYDAQFPFEFSGQDLRERTSHAFFSWDEALTSALNDIREGLAEGDYDDWATVPIRLTWLSDFVAYAIVDNRVWIVAIHEREFPDEPTL